MKQFLSKRSILFAAFMVVMSSLNALAASEFMLPQPKPAEGPWFEGWYIRVTDSAQKRSFATITTSATQSTLPLKQNSVLPGYVAFIESLHPGASSRSIEYFPQETWATETGSGENNSHFTWTAGNLGTLSDQALNLTLPSGDEVHVDFGERMPWSSENPNWGPEGWLGFVKALPLHWYVDSLGTPVHYKIKIGATGEIIAGQGFAHVEKNWGRSFPAAWMWGQATNTDNSAHLAFAGGPVQVGPVQITSYLVGYKTKDLDIEIRPDELFDAQYSTVIDACNGTFQLFAGNSYYQLKIIAHAELADFASISIPTINGYKQGGRMESFGATIDVTVYRENVLIETRHFERAALEFGANNMVCKTRSLDKNRF